MKIVADENIPRVADAFAELGDITLLPGRSISRQHLQDCQCLLVRTVTQVDRDLLEGTAVEFVASATIGTDHIDLDYLHQHNIGISNAAGCNAEAASEYVISGLFALAEKRGFDPMSLRAGIIGHGNVGSRLAQKLAVLGIDTQINDPPQAEHANNRSGQQTIEYVDLDTIIAECDMISLHVPLTRDGAYPTWHLFDEDRLGRLRQHGILVNAARGPVVDNQALLTLLDQRDDLCIFLDTWEAEPNLSRTLLEKVDLATPHIAGYSVEGRLRGTQMILDAACRHFALSSSWQMACHLPEPILLEVDSARQPRGFWPQLFHQHHDIWQDHRALTNSRDLSDTEFGRHFDSLRRVYEQRFEYERYTVRAAVDKKTAAQLERLQFGLA